MELCECECVWWYHAECGVQREWYGVFEERNQNDKMIPPLRWLVIELPISQLPSLGGRAEKDHNKRYKKVTEALKHKGFERDHRSEL